MWSHMIPLKMRYTHRNWQRSLHKSDSKRHQQDLSNWPSKYRRFPTSSPTQHLTQDVFLQHVWLHPPPAKNKSIKIIIELGGESSPNRGENKDPGAKSSPINSHFHLPKLADTAFNVARISKVLWRSHWACYNWTTENSHWHMEASGHHQRYTA